VARPLIGALSELHDGPGEGVRAAAGTVAGADSSELRRVDPASLRSLDATRIAWSRGGMLRVAPPA
jgi:hypothetical protein